MKMTLNNRGFTYVSHQVVLFPQPTDHTCWYAATRMILNLRSRGEDMASMNHSRGEDMASMNHSRHAREMIRERARREMHGVNTGPQARIEMDGVNIGPEGGIYPEYSNIEMLARGNGMTLHGQQTWPIDGLFNLLKEGPIAIMGSRPTLHAVVIYAMVTNGEPAGTTVKILDPWPSNRGRRYISNYVAMMKQFPLTTRYILQKPSAWPTAIVQATNRSIRR